MADESTETINDASFLSAPVANPTSSTVATSSLAATSTATPTKATEAKANDDFGIVVVQRTSVRKVRGEPRKVTVPTLDIWIGSKLVDGKPSGGKMIAYTDVRKNMVVRAITEVLPEEIPAVLDAVVAYRSDDATPRFQPRPRFSQDQIDGLS